MGSFQDTFKPVNVSKVRGPLGEEEDVIEQGADQLSFTTPSTPAPVAEEPVEEPVEEPSSFDSMFTPVEEEPVGSFDSMFTPTAEEEPLVPVTGEVPLHPLQVAAADPTEFQKKRQEEYQVYYDTVLGDIEPQSYSPDDLAKRDDTYRVIETYMLDRYGIQAVEGRSKEDVVEKFLNNRRNVAMSGNSVSVVTEFDYINDIRENPAKMKNAGAAYLLYENMQGVTHDDYTWGELGWSTLDVVKGVATDPITWLTAGAGKLVSGAMTKGTTQAVEKIVARTIQEQIKKGISREAIKTNAKRIYREAATKAVAEGTEDIARFAAQQKIPALQRLTTKQALIDIGTTTALDATAGAGMEYLYQTGLVETGVQGEVNKYAVGLAALGSLVVGGAVAGGTAKRGFSKTALPTEAIAAGDPKKAVSDLEQSIRDFFSENVEANVSWADKVGKGGELNVQDTNFFIDFLLGTTGKVKKAKPAAKAVEQPKVSVSNPGGEWLDSKLASSEATRLDAEPGTYAANLGDGRTTGYYKDPITLDPKVLAEVRGATGEEAFRDTGSKLARLEQSIAKDGYKPDPILIHVREDGVPFIVEGNHRLAEALKSGRPGIDVEIKYLNGAEDVDGILKPGSLPVPKVEEVVEEVTETALEGGSEVSLKGLAQVMQEQGFFYVKRMDDDTVSNFISDFIKENLDAEDIGGIVTAYEKSTGTKLGGFLDDAGKPVKGTPTPDQFANAFARKMHDQARGLNAASQVAKRLDINIEDLDIDTFLKDQLGLLGADTSSRVSKIAPKVIANWQNRYIRTLVSHLGTSKLNVLGWGVSSAMGSANDMVRAVGLATRAGYNTAIGNAEKGVSDWHLSKSLVKSNANRVNLMLDPNMTAAAFNSAVQRSAGPLGELGKVQAGGIDVAQSIGDLIDRTKVGAAADAYIEGAQLLTFVRAQDTFTKSQQYVFEMDKALRSRFGKSWNEFYHWEDVNKAMATKEYKMLEQEAVTKTLEHTFSTSFKGSGLIGEVAGMLEDVRNLPGIGMMVPFGKFFNNTVHFTAKNTPILNNVLKVTTGKFADKSHGELAAQGMIAGGVVATYVANAQEKRTQGLGLYEEIDESTGEVVSREYDYPLSLFMAAGHLASYRAAGEPVPDEVVTRIIEDFGITGLSRNLTTSTQGVVDSVKVMVAGEILKGADQFGEELAGVAAQFMAGFTRPLEGVDTVIGITTGADMRPRNTKDGNKFFGKALTYMDNTTQLLTGGPIGDVKVGAATGEADVVTSKQLGTRTVFLTDTMRVMNMLEYETWDENAKFAVMEMAAEAGNEYNKVFFRNVETVAEQVMNDEEFRLLPVEDQRAMWKDTVESIRKTTKEMLSYEDGAAGTTFGTQIELVNKFGRDGIAEGMEELGFEGDLGDLNTVEIENLKSYLGNLDDLGEYTRGTRSWMK